jgi:uncharacterized lipoprotein YddW (UPF0748 family)
MKNPRRFMLRILISFICTVLIAYSFLSFNATFAQTDPPEIRGVWLTNVNSNILYNNEKCSDDSKECLGNAIEEIRKFNFNTIYPTIYQGGYTLYDSEVMKTYLKENYKEAPKLKGKNLLDKLVSESRKQKLTLIPWLEFGFMVPSSSELGQYATKENDWLTKKYDGSVKDNDASNSIGQPIVWLNPFQPKVQKFMLNLIKEIISKEGVDGIQLDDHFGLPVEFGYDDYTISLYQKEHDGKSPPTPDKDAQGNIKENSEWEEWKSWRANKITQFITEISKTVKQIKPNSIISLSPLEYPWSFDHHLVDWPRWIDQKLVDEVVVQTYFQGDVFDKRVKLEKLKNPTDIKQVAIGIHNANDCKQIVEIEEIRRQVEEVRKIGYAGVSFFFYDTLWNKEPKLLKEGGQKVFHDLFLKERQEVFHDLFPTFVKRPNLLNH